DGVRDYAVTLVGERYADFGPTLATEKLAERDGLRVSRETVRGWMVDAGLWLSRKQRRTFHQPRLRREAYGELVQ
ncbi:ISNCY family transposase, partial [Rhizobium sp. RHZ01]|nr:ISNCY family transposase [Rhizobium sp. RHZ01]